GFLLPISKSRKALNSPTPTTICLPSGDQDGPRIKPFCSMMERAGLPSSTRKRVVDRSGLIFVTARCSPLGSYAGNSMVLYRSNFGLRLHCFTGSGLSFEVKRAYTTCAPSGDHEGKRSFAPAGPGVPFP